MSGALDGTNGICPTTRAMAPAIAATMIAPVTPDPLSQTEGPP